MRHFYVLWALVILLAGATTFAIVKVEGVQHHQNDALHSIICRAEHFIRTQPGISDEQRRKGLRFYQQALTGAHLAPCEAS